MNKEIFTKRLKSLTTKQGLLETKYVDIIDDIMNSDKFHYFRWVGNQNKKPYKMNRESLYLAVLDVLKLPYTRGNDAPRGGQEGNYLALDHHAIQALREVRNEYRDEHAKAHNSYVKKFAAIG